VNSDGPGDALVERPLGGGGGLGIGVVEGHEERVVPGVGEARLGGCGEEHGTTAGDLQDRQTEVGEGRADQEVGAGVEQFLGGESP
jgi:hypothetical protein